MAAVEAAFFKAASVVTPFFEAGFFEAACFEPPFGGLGFLRRCRLIRGGLCRDYRYAKLIISSPPTPDGSGERGASGRPRNIAGLGRFRPGPGGTHSSITAAVFWDAASSETGHPCS